MSKLPRRSEKFRAAHRLQALTGFLLSLLGVCLVAYVVFFLWLVPVRVAGASMTPAFLEGEIVLVDRAAKLWKVPRRGDVVEFSDPQFGGTLLKRIIALPGETVDIADGQVYIGGRPLDERAYVQNPGSSPDLESVTVPAGCVFVLSDNRETVYDSRADEVGCIAYDDIRGVVRFRIYPRTKLAFYY